MSFASGPGGVDGLGDFGEMLLDMKQVDGLDGVGEGLRHKAPDVGISVPEHDVPAKGQGCGSVSRLRALPIAAE